ncbi:MAG: hypothetical protein QNL90_12705 [Gammaproteobacteria bacterium]|nr:hypothetical protein [Gammaproteobacteria bacterium]MDX2460985.1 hypothetical protein [Gammaproteobacteria bacterium]
MSDEVLTKTRFWKHRTGCLLPLALFIVAATAMYFVTRPPAVTSDFKEQIASTFSVAVVIEKQSGFEYVRTTLETINSRPPELPPARYLLPEPEVRMDYENLYVVKVIEDHGDWQLIEFSYANTYDSTSIYKAYSDRVEPVYFRINSHVGQVMLALPLALVIYVLAVLIAFIRNWRARHSEIQKSKDLL